MRNRLLLSLMFGSVLFAQPQVQVAPEVHVNPYMKIIYDDDTNGTDYKIIAPEGRVPAVGFIINTRSTPTVLLAQNTPPSTPLPPCATPSQTMPPCQAPSLDQGVLASSQVPGSPNYTSSYAWVIPASVQLTDAIYWASQPPAVQALLPLAGLPGPYSPGQNPATMTPRYKLALELAQQGFCIDVPIMAFGDDPVVDMLLRTEMNIAVIPCGLGPGVIKTSLTPSDYPPFPVPPAPPVSTIMVGVVQSNPNMGTFYGSTPYALAQANARKLVNGQVFTENGVTYLTHLSYGLMGITLYFTAGLLP